MTTPAEELDVFELVLPRVVLGRVCPPPDPFSFQQLEETFSDRVVVTIAASAHAGFQVVLAQECLPLPAGELGALV